MSLSKKSLLPLLTIIVLLLSSCGASASVTSVSATVSAPAVPPSVSPSATAAGTASPASPSPSLITTLPPSPVYTPTPEVSPEVTPLDEQGDDEDVDTGDDNSGYPDETTSPHAMGYGSLPKSLLGIEPVSTDNYSPDKVVDYLLSGLPEFDDAYFVDKAEVKNGKLCIYLTDDVSVNADKAYKYLKTTFSLSDDQVMALPLFSDPDNSCEIHKGHMYTSDGWDIKTGDEPEDYDEEYDYNSVELKEVTLPGPVPVADDAKITLVDYFGYFTGEDQTGCRVTVKQFEEFLLSDNGKYVGDLSLLWFKYSNSEITAIAEQYAP